MTRLLQSRSRAVTSGPSCVGGLLAWPAAGLLASLVVVPFSINWTTVHVALRDLFQRLLVVHHLDTWGAGWVIIGIALLPLILAFVTRSMIYSFQESKPRRVIVNILLAISIAIYLAYLVKVLLDSGIGPGGASSTWRHAVFAYLITIVMLPLLIAFTAYVAFHFFNASRKTRGLMIVWLSASPLPYFLFVFIIHEPKLTQALFGAGYCISISGCATEAGYLAEVLWVPINVFGISGSFERFMNWFFTHFPSLQTVHDSHLSSYAPLYFTFICFIRIYWICYFVFSKRVRSTFTRF